jgi:hypothetical protein
MKRISTLLILLLAVLTISAQDIAGTWSGALSFPDQTGQLVELRINFNITKTDDGYISTMDSPDQDAYGLAVDETTFTASELRIKASAYSLEYTGKLEDKTTLNGTLTQHGQSLELNLKLKTD